MVQAGRPGEAIEHFQQALRLKPQFTDAYYNLALAYAGMHQSSEAVAAAGKALELARSQGQTALARQIEDWLNSYSAGQPDPRKMPPAPEGHSKPPLNFTMPSTAVVYYQNHLPLEENLSKSTRR